MAKSKSFFGLRKGSTKSLTFSVYNGQQVTKDRVTEVKNPRTASQMKQRMLMATILQAYSAGKVLFDHSIEGLSYGQKTMNEFIRMNLKAIRANADATPQSWNFNAYGNPAVQANPLQISRGSLVAYDTANDLTFSAAQVHAKIAAAGASTLGAIKAYLGLSAGDYFTIVAMICNSSNKSEFNDVEQINNGQIVFARCYVPTDDDSTAVTNDNFNTLFKIETSSGVTVAFQAPTNEAAGKVIVYTTQLQNVAPVAAGLIKSGKSNESWRRSTQFFKLNSSVIGLSMAAALSSYPMGEDYILNGGESHVTPTSESQIWMPTAGGDEVQINRIEFVNGYAVAYDNEDTPHYFKNVNQKSDVYGMYLTATYDTLSHSWTNDAPAGVVANDCIACMEHGTVADLNASQMEEYLEFAEFCEAYGVPQTVWVA